MTMQKDQCIQLIWKYHLMNHTLKKSDCILVLGSHDLRVAERAIQLYQDQWAGYLIFSGGLGRLTEGVWQQTEAERFGALAVQQGVPEDKILLENQSTNTGENLRLTRRLLDEKGLRFDTFIVVQKPYMERRAYATFKKEWPDKDCVVTSPLLDFETYCQTNDPDINREIVTHLLVGDLQRIRVYADKGFQISQEIPADVWEAYETLKAMGYTKHLIPE